MRSDGRGGSRTKVAFIVVLIAAWLAVPWRAYGAPPLLLEEVLDTLPRTHPTLEVAQRQLDAARGEALAARGGFDPALSVTGKWQPLGYYSNGQLDAVVVQPIPVWGISAYTGYRLGWGSYPIYSRDLKTLSQGEVRTGLTVPLWRNSRIDERRGRVAQTRIRERQAGQELDARELEIQAAAAEAYWTWVAKGQSLDVVRDLLADAEARQDAIAEQVAAGAVEPIQLVDNRRLVLERAARVVAIEREFQEAALRLSLFFRDAELRPIVPGEERVPERFPDPQLVDLPSLQQAVEDALRRRPDVAALMSEVRAAEVGVRLARNERAPNIDLDTFVAKDFGEGPVLYEPLEWGIGATFEMPLLLREARGKLQAAQADVAATRAEVRGLRDRVAAEVRLQYVALRAALKTAKLAIEQFEAADRLVGAERTRLTLGASDLVVVNLRELAAADAQLEAISALADYQQAKVDYLITTGRSPIGYVSDAGL